MRCDGIGLLSGDGVVKYRFWLGLGKVDGAFTRADKLLDLCTDFYRPPLGSENNNGPLSGLG